MTNDRLNFAPGRILVVCIICAQCSLYISSYLALLPVMISVLMLAGTYHLAYTGFHEAVHGLLGKRLNPIFGFALGQVMGVSFSAHKFLHNQKHHNDGTRVVRQQVESRAAENFVRVLMDQYLSIFKPHLGNTNITLCASTEILCIFCSRIWLINTSPNPEFIYVVLIAPILGAFVIYLIFDYFVHKATSYGRITITHIFPKYFHALITRALAFQNYHVVHHIEPNTPFHLYPSRFEHLVSKQALENHEVKIWFSGSGKVAKLDP